MRMDLMLAIIICVLLIGGCAALEGVRDGTVAVFDGVLDTAGELSDFATNNPELVEDVEGLGGLEIGGISIASLLALLGGYGVYRKAKGSGTPPSPGTPS